MNNLLKNRFYIFIIFFCCSCKQQSSTEATYTIINQNFISIVDTVAYKYNSLRPYPNQPMLLNRRTEYPIAVCNRFLDINQWNDLIVMSLKNDSISNKQDYLDLYKKARQSNSATLEISKIKNTGLYKLYPTEDSATSHLKGFVGRVNFSNIVENGQIGIMVVAIQDNIKSGIEKLVLLKNNNNNWMISREIEMVVW